MNQQFYGEGANRKQDVVFTLGMAALMFICGAGLGAIYVYGGMLAGAGA